MYKEVQIGRLYQKIVEQIEVKILNGELRPGDRLPPERELTRQFGVSRTAVREAMKTLTLRGLIEICPGKGTFVTDGTTLAMQHSLNLLIKIGMEEGIRSLLEVREILEPEIAVLAAIRAKDEHIAAMQDAVIMMDNSMNDANAFVEADMDFHLALAEGAQNAMILSLIDALVEPLRDLRTRLANVHRGVERAQEHHKRVLEAVMRRDVESARQAMVSHLKQAREDSEVSLGSSG